MKETTSDIENVEIRTALDMFFEQSHQLARSAINFSNYCDNLLIPVTPNIKKYIDPANKLLDLVRLALDAYREANVHDQGGLDKRMMALVTSCVNDVVELRKDLSADFTKMQALNEVSEAKTFSKKIQRTKNDERKREQRLLSVTLWVVCFAVLAGVVGLIVNLYTSLTSP